ncbi:MAG TPA: putative entry exclusion protein TrbK-alt [Sphingomonadaceae bacterium]|nr:putative entry exclusion protein TrbK-alt [Sphingomonadaceae bacterium]
MIIEADIAPVVRFTALAFAVLAICLAAAELDRGEPAETSTAAPATSSDPIKAQLARCRAITDPARVDDSCRRAWAELRTRFFSVPDTEP